MALFSKLSTKEIDKTIARIKEEYNHGIVHFGLSLSCKKLFEERLREVLLDRKDLTQFLSVEIQVVKELIIQAEQALSPQEAVPAPKQKSYADRVIEKLQSRIKNYPELFLGDFSQKSLDVEKLYGSLDWFSKNIWNDLYSLLIKKNPFPVLYTLDDQLALLIPWQGRFPKALERYIDFLTYQVPIEELARAQNQCLLTAAHFLHKAHQGLEGFLADGKRNEWIKENPTQEDLAFLEKAVQFLCRILYDFRLRDLKPIT